jgi:hypothetical protein
VHTVSIKNTYTLTNYAIFGAYPKHNKRVDFHMRLKPLHRYVLIFRQLNGTFTCYYIIIGAQSKITVEDIMKCEFHRVLV